MALFRRTSRSDPEKVFIVCKNSYSTASLTNGQYVDWDFDSEADGVSVTLPNQRTANVTGMGAAGIAAETIALNAYGLIQVYGYHSAVIVDSSTTVDIYTGAPLFMSVAGVYLEGPYAASGTTDSMHVEHRPVACALEGYGSVATTGTIKAVIFAM